MSTMLPTRRSTLAPWREMNELQNRLRRFLGEPLFEAETMGWFPAMDLVETDGELELTAELPGVDPKDVDVEIEGSVLTVRGEKRGEREEEQTREGRKVRISERSYGEFSRSFTLPSTVDAEKIKAEFQKGLLKVQLPKRKEAMGRRIEVKAK
jgi:HSP20 family protein